MATDLLERLEETCALISCPSDQGGTFGTGYLISNFLVATCLHVVENAGAEGIFVIFPGATRRKATLDRWCSRSDVAVLRLRDEVTIEPFARRAACATGDKWNAWGYLDIGASGASIAGEVRHPRVACSEDRSITQLQLNSSDLAACAETDAHGLSGSPVVVNGAIVGHLVKVRLGAKPGPVSMGQAHACSIADVEKLLEPDELARPRLPPPWAPHYSSDSYVHHGAAERSATHALDEGPQVVLRGPYRSGKSMTCRHLLDELHKGRPLDSIVKLEVELLAGFPEKKWFEYLAGRIALKSDLKIVAQTAKDFEPSLYWTARLTEWMEGVLLPALGERRVVLWVEGASDPDHLREQTQLYRLLRIWALRAPSAQWSKLRILATFSTMPTLLNRDPEVSRLSIDPDPIDLVDFDATQAGELARAHGVQWSQDDIRKRLASHLGGHPFLLAIAMYDARLNRRHLHEVAAGAESNESIFKGHLDSLFERLVENDDIIELLQRVFNQESQSADLKNPLLAKLTAAGILRGDSTRGYEAGYGIYRTYFNQRWPTPAKTGITEP